MVRAMLAMAGAMALVLIVSLAAATPASAQSYRFNAVSIQGNARVESGTILSYAGISRGQTVSGAQLNDAYQRLVNSGLFEAVELQPQGGTLVIKVTEYPTINVINIEGNRRLKDADLLSAIGSKARRIYSPAQAEEDAARIVDAYEARGRLAATVKPKIIRRTDNRVDLVFEVIEGKVVEIERLSFVGNRRFSDGRLRRVLSTKQAGIFRQLIQRDSYDADRVEFDKQVLRDFYLSRGYHRLPDQVGVQRVLARAQRLLHHLRCRGRAVLQVRQRQRRVRGRGRRRLGLRQKLIEIRRGSTYTPSAVDNAIARMEGLALRQGLTFVRVDPRVTRNDAAGTLDIQFAIVRGPRIFVERIDIEGNATTLDRVIRTQFKTVEGDPFNPREIREAGERIRALGFFSNADVQARQGSASDQVVVDVNVEEQNTGSLSFGATYGADAGVGLSLAFSETNFLGRGQGLSFEVTTTSGTQAYVFNFSEPNVLGRDLKLLLGLSFRETRELQLELFVQHRCVHAGGRIPGQRERQLSLRYTLGYGEIYRVDDGDTNNDGFNDGDINMNGVEDPGETFTSGSSAILLAEQARGASWRSGVGATYTYDTRRGGLDPNSGVLLRFGTDFLGLGGDTHSFKTTALVLGERKVLNEEVTLRASLEGGVLTLLGGGNSRIIDRFILGSQQFRGFAYGGIGPRDLAVTNRDALGGNYFAVARFEAEFPLGLPEEYGINGGAVPRRRLALGARQRQRRARRRQPGRRQHAPAVVDRLLGVLEHPDRAAAVQLLEAAARRKPTTGRSSLTSRSRPASERRQRRRAAALAGLAVLSLLAPPALAQDAATPAPDPAPLVEVPAPFLTLDQDRLFSESAFGKRVAAELDSRSQALATENREIEAELYAEEQALTDCARRCRPTSSAPAPMPSTPRCRASAPPRTPRPSDLQASARPRQQRFFDAARRPVLADIAAGPRRAGGDATAGRC